MKQKCLTIIVALLLIMTSTAAYAEDVTLNIGLQDAINMAMKDNPQLVSAETKIEDAQRQHEEAKRDRKEATGPVRLPSGISLAFVKNGYYVDQAAIGIECAKREKAKTESNMAYDVTKKYYSVKLAESLYNSSAAAYNLAVENKSSVDKSFELGLASGIDVSNAAYAVAQTKAACSSSERNLALAMENLKISLQVEDMDTELILTDGIDYIPFQANITEDIQKAMETRYDIYSLKSVRDQALRYKDVTGLLLGIKSSEYSSANQSFVQSEYTYTNTKKMIGLSIKSSYNEILNAADSLNLAEQNLNLKTQEYDIAKVQYEIGMLTNSQLTATLNAMTSAKIELENAKLTYKLAVEKYGYEITTGL